MKMTEWGIELNTILLILTNKVLGSRFVINMGGLKNVEFFVTYAFLHTIFQKKKSKGKKKKVGRGQFYEATTHSLLLTFQAVLSFKKSILLTLQ